MSKLKLKKQDDRPVKTEPNVWTWVIGSGWLVGSIFLGWLLSFITQPPDLIISLYSNFEPYVNNYNLFCLVMTAILFLMPFSFLLILKFGFDEVYFKPGGGWILALSSVLFLVMGFGMMGFEGGSKYTRAVRDLISSTEWLGAVLFSFISLLLFVCVIAVLMKNRRSY